jgi:hypothetical protein
MTEFPASESHCPDGENEIISKHLKYKCSVEKLLKSKGITEKSVLYGMIRKVSLTRQT